MIFTGMIFQFNNDEGTGLIMLSDGGTKEFSTAQWVDESNEPTIGQKISYDESDNLIKIKVLSDDTSIVQTKKKEPAHGESEIPELSSVDEYIEYFKSLGYKLAKDIDNANERTASLRIFLEDGHAEMIVKSSDGNISITKMVNGKKVN